MNEEVLQPSRCTQNWSLVVCVHIAAQYELRQSGCARWRGRWFYKPAAARSAAALSVRSQVNSGSSRPKWP